MGVFRFADRWRDSLRALSSTAYQPQDSAQFDRLMALLEQRDADLERHLETPSPVFEYEPTWGALGTAPVLGNGTLTGEYTYERGELSLLITLTAGSTTTFGSSSFTFSMPPGFQRAYARDMRLHGTHAAVDVSGNDIYGLYTYCVTASAFACYYVGGGGPIDATSPFTFTTGDVIVLDGSLRAIQV